MTDRRPPTGLSGPIHRAWRTRVRNRRRADGPVAGLLRVAGLVAALLLAVPIVSEMFLGWLAGPPDQHADAIQALLLRSGIVVVGWITLDVYSAVIRDGDREVLAIWPVDPGEVARFELVRAAVDKGWMPVATGVLFAPILSLDPLLWALTVVHTCAMGVLAIGLSGLVVLGAVDASDHPSAKPFLDLVRGQNHPAQAAFIYAPALVLLVGGVASAAAGAGVAQLAAGNVLGAVLLALPVIVGAVAFARVPGLARRNWFRAGHVMAEVDARYALLEDQEEMLAVYLDWTVRFLPARIGLYALRDLRHGWRERRTWISGAWLAGLGALAMSWTGDVDGPGRTALGVVVATWWLSAVALRLEADEPAFLKAWLPPDAREQGLARLVVVLLWTQPVVWMGALGAGFWRGSTGLLLVGGVGLLSAVLAAGVAVLAARRGGLVVYGPLAAVMVLGVAQGVLG